MQENTKKKSSAERTRLYRERIKLNKRDYEDSKEKDKTRKQRARQIIRHDPEKKKDSLKKNTEYVRRYRARKRAQREQDGLKENQTPQSQADKKRYAYQVQKVKQERIKLKKKEETLKRREAVLRTQRWRLKVKLEKQPREETTGSI